jgi:hypothetical protein
MRASSAATPGSSTRYSTRNGRSAKRWAARSAEAGRPVRSSSSSARITRRRSFGWRCSRSRVQGREAPVQALGVALLGRPLRLLLELAAQRRVGRRIGEQPFQERADVEARAAHQEHRAAAPVDLGGGGPRVGRVAAGVVRLVGAHHVEQVVRDARALLERRLGGPDVEVAVDLHRVGVHDLAAEAQGELDRERRLAGGGRARHDDDGRRLRCGGRHGQARPKRRSSSARESGTATGRPWGQVGAHGISSSAASSARCSPGCRRSPARRAA